MLDNNYMLDNTFNVNETTTKILSMFTTTFLQIYTLFFVLKNSTTF